LELGMFMSFLYVFNGSFFIAFGIFSPSFGTKHLST
jgi:hypothetical protein